MKDYALCNLCVFNTIIGVVDVYLILNLFTWNNNAVLVHVCKKGSHIASTFCRHYAVMPVKVFGIFSSG